MPEINPQLQRYKIIMPKTTQKCKDEAGTAFPIKVVSETFESLFPNWNSPNCSSQTPQKGSVSLPQGSNTSHTLLTCPAPPGRQFRDLVPPFLLEVVAFHASDSLWCLAPNHHHQLQRQKWRHLNTQFSHSGISESYKDTGWAALRSEDGRVSQGNNHLTNTEKASTRGHRLELLLLSSTFCQK